LPMSALRRQLTGLTDGGLVAMQMSEEGTGSAWLTEEGVNLCQSVFGDTES